MSYIRKINNFIRLMKTKIRKILSRLYAYATGSNNKKTNKNRKMSDDDWINILDRNMAKRLVDKIHPDQLTSYRSEFDPNLEIIHTSDIVDHDVEKRITMCRERNLLTIYMANKLVSCPDDLTQSTTVSIHKGLKVTTHQNAESKIFYTYITLFQMGDRSKYCNIYVAHVAGLMQLDRVLPMWTDTMYYDGNFTPEIPKSVVDKGCMVMVIYKDNRNKDKLMNITVIEEVTTINEKQEMHTQAILVMLPKRLGKSWSGTPIIHKESMFLVSAGYSLNDSVVCLALSLSPASLSTVLT